MIERLLIVGFGSIGRRHMRLAGELRPDVRIGVVSRRSRPEPEASGAAEWFGNVEDALAMRPHAAIVANPTTLHVETAMTLARAGVHLLIEKPMSSSPAGIAELLALARNNGVTLMVGYNLRFLPSLRRFGELLRTRRMGRILSVRSEVGQWLPAWRPDRDYREAVSGRASLGGGVLLELSHEIDYLRWLFGEVDWVRAVQLVQSDLEIDVEDTAHLILGMSMSGGSRVVATLNMDFIRHDTTRTCTAIGDGGSLRWNGLDDTVEFYEAGQNAWQTVFCGNRDPDESYRAELQHFFDCAAEGRAPLVTGDEGLAALTIVQAARRSSDSGSMIRVDMGAEPRAVGGAG